MNEDDHTVDERSGRPDHCTSRISRVRHRYLNSNYFQNDTGGPLDLGDPDISDLIFLTLRV